MFIFVTEIGNYLQVNIVHNQPYDESLDVSDGEEIASTNATPRDIDQQHGNWYDVFSKLFIN